MEAVFYHAQMGWTDARLVDAAGGKARIGQQITREVFANELIQGDVRVEGADEIVAVLEGTRNFGVAFATMGLGVANKVHPVSGPVLAKSGGVEKLLGAFTQGLFRILSVGGTEGADVLRLWGKACEEEVQPAHQDFGCG